MFPAFLDFTVDEIHVEMASREFAELEIIGEIARRRDVAVGVIDVKSYYIETPQDVAERARRCLKFAPAERLSFAPDCGLSQTARWAARQKLKNLVEGVKIVRGELNLG
jgi:5-methyltetrahydropteroyltriglutamate--homocysteine methyltransferase